MPVYPVLKNNKPTGKWDAIAWKDGKRYRRRFPSEEQAWAFIAEILSGQQSFQSGRVQLKEFLPEYIRYCRVNKSADSYRVDVSRLRIFTEWCNKQNINQLSDITPRSMEKFKNDYLHQTRGNRNPKSTMNKYIQLIKAMLSWAVKMQYMKENPIKHFEQLKDIRRRFPRYFTADELAVIFKVARQPYREFFRILAYTGLRAGELMYLEWSDIDGKNIKVQSKAGWNPKTYEIRSVPISAKLKSVLKSLPKEGRYVFDDGHDNHRFKRDTALGHLKNILRLNDLPDGNLYSFRHTFGSHLIMAGIDLITVKNLMGHASVTTTEQYLHLSPKRAQDAVERLEY